MCLTSNLYSRPIPAPPLLMNWSRLLRLSLSGASSTSGENILVDLSDTFQDPEADFQYVEETNMLRVGISFSLKEVDWF